MTAAVRPMRNFAVLLVLLLSACPPAPTAPPAAPVIVAPVTNADLSAACASGPATVTTGRIIWQHTNPTLASTFTWGWLEDALVGNQLSFQLLLDTDLGGNSFSVQDASGNPLTAVPPLSNLSHECSSASGQPMPGTACYWSPGNAGYVAPVPVPANKAVYSLSVVNTCNGAIAPPRTAFGIADRTAHCSAGQVAGAAVLLTVSPPQTVVANTPVRFILVSTNAAGSASTPFDAVWLNLPHNPGIVQTTTSTKNRCPDGSQPRGFSFDLTCHIGCFSKTVPLGNPYHDACSRDEARQTVIDWYGLQHLPACVLGP